MLAAYIRSLRGNEASLATLSILASTFLWGTMWIPLRYLEGEGLQGIWPTVVINVAGGCFFLLLLLIRRQPVRQPGQLLVIGILFGVGLFGYGGALVITTVIKATLLFYLTPVWGTVIGCVFLKEKLTPRRIIAVIGGLLGLFIILGGDLNTVPLPSNAGDWLALASGICWSLGCFLAFTSIPRGTIELTVSMCIGSIIVAAAFVLAFGLEVAGAPPDLAGLHAVSIAAIVIVAIHFIPLSLLTMWGTPRLPPARVGILLMLEVVIAVTLAALLTDDPFGLREIIGAALVLAAGVIEVSGGGKPADDHQA